MTFLSISLNPFISKDLNAEINMAGRMVQSVGL